MHTFFPEGIMRILLGVTLGVTAVLTWQQYWRPMLVWVWMREFHR